MSEEQEETCSMKVVLAIFSIWALASSGFTLMGMIIFGFENPAVYIFGLLWGFVTGLYFLFTTVSARRNIDRSKIRKFLELSEQVFGHVVGITSQFVDSDDHSKEYTTTIKYEYRKAGASEPEEFTYIHKSSTKKYGESSTPRLLIRPDQPQTPILRDELELMLINMDMKNDVIRNKCKQRAWTLAIALFIIGSSLPLMLAYGPTIVAFYVSYILVLFALIYCLERAGCKPINADYSSSIKKEFISVHSRSFCEAFGDYFFFWIVCIPFLLSIILVTPVFWINSAMSVQKWITPRALKRYGTSAMGNLVYRFDGSNRHMVVVFQILKASTSQSPSEQRKQQDEHDEVYRYYKVILCKGSDEHAPCVEIDEWMYRRDINPRRLPNDENDQVETEVEQVAIVVPPATSPWIAALKTNAQQQTFSISASLGFRLFLLLICFFGFIFLQTIFFSLLFVAVFNAAMAGIAIVGVMTKYAIDFGLFGLPFARNETAYEKVSHEAEMTMFRSTDEEASATADISSTASSE